MSGRQGAVAKQPLSQEVDEHPDLGRQVAVGGPQRLEATRAIDLRVQQRAQSAGRQRLARQEIRHAANAEPLDGRA